MGAMMRGSLTYLLGWTLLVTPACSAPQGKTPAAAPVAAASALDPKATGGFDGQKAFAHVQNLVAIGPRSSGTDGIRKAQEYIRAALKGFGCTVEEDDFQSPTPIGQVSMKNIVAKVRGARGEIVLLLTHYDTLRMENFVGANDGGSSTGVMLELARFLCARKGGLSVWIAFLDGEEAFVKWSATDSTYGSRQLAARMALSGDLKRVKAVILADLVGYRNLRVRREASSTEWLTDLVWNTAARLGYQQQFLNDEISVEDDHTAFLRRNVPAVDIIQLSDYPHWHTPQDTLDKISPRSLAIVGHVILEVLPALETKPR